MAGSMLSTRLTRAVADVSDEQADLGGDRAAGGIDAGPGGGRRRGGGRADSQPADQAPGVDGERNLSPRKYTAGGDNSDKRARFTYLDREQLDASRSLQRLVEHGRADLGEEGCVEVGVYLRVGHGQMGHRCDEPPELGPGRRIGRDYGLRGSRRGCGGGRSRGRRRPRRAARSSQEHHRGNQHQERPRWTVPPTTPPATEPGHSFSSCSKYPLWRPPDQSRWSRLCRPGRSR